MVVNWGATCCDPPAWWIMDWYLTYQPIAHDLCSQLQQMLRLSHTISAETQHLVGVLDTLLDHRDQVLKRSMCTSSNQCIKHQVYSNGFGVDCAYIKVIQTKKRTSQWNTASQVATANVSPLHHSASNCPFLVHWFPAELVDNFSWV